MATGLIRVRSPLLTESRLMSFPPGTEMFQFPGFAFLTYFIQLKIPNTNPDTLTSEEIKISKSVKVGFPIQKSRD